MLVAMVLWAGLQGQVVDGVTGEPLARVKVSCGSVAVVTKEDGRFALGCAAGPVVIETVGYRPFRLDTLEGEVKVDLFPETLRRKESVTVEAGVFGREEPLAVSLEGNDLKNLASVLADDPMRAAQALPGAATNDDFTSQFSVRGAGPQRVGFYLDDVLLHAPFHAVQGEATSGSLALVNGDTLDGMNLFASAPPLKYGDRLAGVLDLQPRDGDAQRRAVRVSASASNVAGVAEGPWGKRASWLVSARQSYLQYLIRRSAENDPSLAFGFTDGSARLAFRPREGHALNLSLLLGRSGLNREEAIPRAGVNSLIYSGYTFSVGQLSYRGTPGAGWTLAARGAWMRERFQNDNRDRSPLGGGGYGEWIGGVDAAWGAKANRLLELGGSTRRLRDDGFVFRYTLTPFAVRPLDRYRGAGVRSGTYGQVSQGFAGGKLLFTGGGRLDHSTVNGQTSLLPYASAAWQVRAGTRVQVAFRQAAQYPDLYQAFSLFGRPGLPAERATHTLAAMEQRVGERTRVRLEYWRRDDRDLLLRPLFEPRLERGVITAGRADAPWMNSVRARSQGWMVFLQRRSANRFSGWVSYAWMESRARESVLRREWVADFDQPHTAQVFGNWRLRQSVNLSARYLFGSGMPVVGYYRGSTRDLFLAEQRNQFRLPPYQRADVRLNKSWQRDRVRWTLFAEVINILNRRNLRPDELAGFDARTGRVRLAFNRMFPVLPSAGVLAEF